MHHYCSPRNRNCMKPFRHTNPACMNCWQTFALAQRTCTGGNYGGWRFTMQVRDMGDSEAHQHRWLPPNLLIKNLGSVSPLSAEMRMTPTFASFVYEASWRHLRVQDSNPNSMRPPITRCHRFVGPCGCQVPGYACHLSSSKNVSRMTFFCDFDLQTRISPQRGAIFADALADLRTRP